MHLNSKKFGIMQSSLVQAFDCLRVNERRFWWHIYCMLPAWISDHERRFADNLSKETAYSWIIVSVSLFRLCGNINGVPDYNRRQKCWNILRSGGNCEIKNPPPPPITIAMLEDDGHVVREFTTMCSSIKSTVRLGRWGR